MVHFRIHFSYPLLLLVFLFGAVMTALLYFRLSKKYRKNRNRITSAAGGGPCLFVGDSCSQDIAGAAACGWKTVWMNRRCEKPEHVCPDYTVTTEQELLSCLQTIADTAQG